MAVSGDFNGGGGGRPAEKSNIQGDHSKKITIPYILPYMNLKIPYIPYSEYRTFFKNTVHFDYVFSL